MTKYLFIGEKRSALARKMNVTWKDGRLAAKHLFTAIERTNIDVDNCNFKNIFREILEYNQVNKTAIREIKKFDGIVVAMGRKVEKVLVNNEIDHKFIYHPATRGVYRNIDKYCTHFKNQISND